MERRWMWVPVRGGSIEQSIHLLRYPFRCCWWASLFTFRCRLGAVASVGPLRAGGRRRLRTVRAQRILSFWQLRWKIHSFLLDLPEHSALQYILYLCAGNSYGRRNSGHKPIELSIYGQCCKGCIILVRRSVETWVHPIGVGVIWCVAVG